ncbi:MAG: peptide ligase PGM1-related protein [Actinomycetota bacterium]
MEQPLSSRSELAARLGSRAPSELDEGLVIVLPSITFPEEELRKIVGIQHYEERLLCLLLLLRHPHLRMVFVSSVRIPEPIIDYYLSFLEDPRSAADRLYVIAIGDPTPRALTEKVLEHPYAPKRLRELGAETEHSYILPFNVTELEARLSEETGVPLYGPSPDLIPLGSKSGSREVAKRAGVPVLPGAENIFSLAELHAAIVELRERNPGARTVVAKLNNGFSGQGNAIIDVDSVEEDLTGANTVFCAGEESWETFGRKVETEGAIVELLVREAGVASPSVQMRILPTGSEEIVSTHDQLLGGPDDQVYLGCRFPAAERYRSVIQDHARAIAKVLSGEGVIGSFAMDFVVGAKGDVFLSEINLRMGGTTHPFLMVRHASQGTYDETTGVLTTSAGPRVYTATDNLKSEAYIGIDPVDVLAAVRDEGLGYDKRSHSGVFLHLLGALRPYGKLGLTCVAESTTEAEGLYTRVVGLLDQLSASYGH